MRHLAFSLLVIAFGARGASLPTGLNRAEVERVVETIGQGGATRLMRSAEAYESWPGIKIGLESALFSSRELDQMGARDGSLPSLLLVPRLHLTKGLFLDIEAMASLLPANVINSFSAYGVGLKWAFISEKNNHEGSVATYVTYTKLNGLRLYDGSNFEFGLLASRDFVRIRPYIGFGFLIARGEVQAAATADNRASHMAAHFSMGFEWELPMNITAQVDFFNLNFAGSIFLGKRL